MDTSVYPPVRGRVFELWFTIRDRDGQTVLSPADLAATATADGRALPVRAVRVANTATGSCVAVLDEVIMAAATILFQATSSTTGAQPYEERLHTAAQTIDHLASRGRRRKEWAWR